MAEFDVLQSDKKMNPLEEFKDLQAKESKANLMILFKDKEIAKLKAQLQEIDLKINQNKKCYSAGNMKSALLHPFIVEEFEAYRKEIQETHQKIRSVTMENFFKKNSESNPPSILNQAVKYMEKVSNDILNEVNQEKIESHANTIDKKKATIESLEQKLKENRAYIKHLESDISETEDLIMVISAKISQTEQQCEDMRKENLKLCSRSKRY